MENHIYKEQNPLEKLSGIILKIFADFSIMSITIEMYFLILNQIVKYLTMPLKFYIRLLTLSPVHINKQVLREIRHEEDEKLNLFDMGHVAIITSSNYK